MELFGHDFKLVRAPPIGQAAVGLNCGAASGATCVDGQPMQLLVCACSVP